VSVLKRNRFIDFIKGVSIVGVFMIHIVGLTYSDEHMNLLSFYIDGFFRFAVPVFFGVLGYMTIMKYTTIDSWTSFYKRKTIQILIPYFLWSTLYFFVPTVYPFVEKTEGKESWLDILMGYSEVHLYFMIPYCTFLFLTPLIVKLYKSQSAKSMSILSIIIVCVHIIFLIFAEQAILHGKRNFYHVTQYSLVIHWMAYYFIGVFLGVNKDKITGMQTEKEITTKRAILITMFYGLIVFVFLATGRALMPYTTPFLLLTSLVAVWWLYVIYVKWGRTIIAEWLTSLGRQTFSFYLSHVLFIKLVFVLLFREEVTFLNLSVVAFLAFGMTLLYMKTEKWSIKKVKKTRNLLDNEYSYIKL
jgi:probable poly-beta-1,6-N-acetyl-D-glucosamine export protein